MIVDILLGFIYLLIYAVTSPLRLLPDVALPVNVTNAITSANAYIQALDFILPVTTLVAVISLILVIDGSIFSYRIIMWIIKKIPTIS